MAKHHKLTSFKTLTFCTQTGLIPRPSHFWTQIDSFQDPVQRTIQNITQLTHFKTLILVYYSVSISMGDYLLNLYGRLPPSITLQNTLHSEISDFFMKQRRKTHHMQVINTFQHPGATRSTLDTAIFIKTNSFQDPRNFTSTVHSNIHLKTLKTQGHHYHSYCKFVHTH